MDTNVTSIIIVGILAVIALVAFFFFRQRTTVEVKGPLGTGLKVDASNQPAPSAPGVKGETIKSRKGGLTAHDETGHGVEVKDVDVEKDVDLKNLAAPKAPPPA